MDVLLVLNAICWIVFAAWAGIKSVDDEWGWATLFFAISILNGAPVCMELF